MTYAEAMHRYGSDKPDLRVKLEFTELTDVMADVDFKVFSGAATMKGGRVVALRVPGGARETGGMSRGEIDAYTEFVKIYGAKGLAYIKVNDLAKGRDGLQSPIVKNIHDKALAEVLARTGAQDGDLIFFGADKAKIVNDAIGALRIKIGHSEFGKKNGLFETGWRPMWVVDFPMFEFDEEAPALHRHAPSLYGTQRRPRRLDGHGPREVHLQGLRHGPQRLGNGRRLGAYPPRRRAAKSV